MGFLWSLGAFIIVIGVLVSVHEFGHFWVARKCGIKIQRFSIGFGKVLWSKTDKHGTEFVVSLIPLGGYVKMLDGRNEDVPPELQSQAFDHKKVWQRALVILAGPLANFIFAIFAYCLIYSIGIPTIKPVIAEVQPESIAAQAQLEANMQILAIDGTSVEDWENINMQLATKLGSAEVELTVQPFGSSEITTKNLNLDGWQFDPENESAFGALGIVPVSNKISLRLSRVAENSPAQRAGLAVGDTILSINGKPADWQSFVQQVQKGEKFEIEFEQKTLKKNTALLPEFNEEKRWYVGVAPTFEAVPDEYRTELKYDILSALQKGLEKTAQLCWLTIKVVGKLFSGDLSLTNLSGPVSIAKGAGASAEIGLVYYLSFMALISVNLGIMNLFPLPVLDGGHLVFLTAEGIMRRPVSLAVQNLFYRIGAVLLLMLTVFALFNDFLRL